MIKITLEQLRKAKACSEQVTLFIQLFGSEVEVTPEKAVLYKDKFDWDWAGRYLLPRLAWEEYDKIAASAREEYDKIKASAFATLYINQTITTTKEI